MIITRPNLLHDIGINVVTHKNLFMFNLFLIMCVTITSSIWWPHQWVAWNQFTRWSNNISSSKAHCTKRRQIELNTQWTGLLWIWVTDLLSLNYFVSDVQNLANCELQPREYRKGHQSSHTFMVLQEIIYRWYSSDRCQSIWHRSVEYRPLLLPLCADVGCLNFV